MPKRAADDDELSNSSKKKAKQDPAPDGLSKDGEGNYYLDLGSMKRATVNVFKGKAQMNIREYYADKDSGEEKPGRKGITLNSAQWSALTSAIPALSKQLEVVVTSGAAEPTTKKPSSEKATKTKAKAKASEKKPPKKKKKKAESEDEESDED